MCQFRACFSIGLATLVGSAACVTRDAAAPTARPALPSGMVDLGAVVTEDLPERHWGKALLQQMKFTRPNSFEVISWEFPMEGGTIHGSNAYYTLFNHGGPHVDAPNHIGAGGGLDTYPLSSFVGPLKVFDVSQFDSGRSVPVDVFQGAVEAGDVVLIYTGRVLPTGDDEIPKVTAPTREAAEFLATLPVAAFGTDAYNVDGFEDLAMPTIHHSFLERGIPVYEQLLNVNQLLDKQAMFFVGVPLNIKGGDGMIVRPVVLTYD